MRSSKDLLLGRTLRSYQLRLATCKKYLAPVLSPVFKD
jgi:hypothetical protein